MFAESVLEWKYPYICLTEPILLQMTLCSLCLIHNPCTETQHTAQSQTY